jgi:hypothetical protein
MAAKKTVKTPKTKAPSIVASLEAGLAAIKSAPATKKVVAAPKAEKAKRVALNPQPIIDAKTAALKEIGVKLQYKGRKWLAGDREFTSLEFSKLSLEALTKLFAK